MNDLAKKGKKQTQQIGIIFGIIIFIGLAKFLIDFINYRFKPKDLLIFTIYISITTFLGWLSFKGKNWTRIVLTILLGPSIVDLIIILIQNTPTSTKSLIIILYLLIVSIGSFYHFGFSKNFKAFRLSQQQKNEEINR